MKRILSFANLSVLLIVFSALTIQSSAQEGAVENRLSTLESRLKTIEDRLQRIESVLFATVKYSEAEARRQLSRAKETLRQSERLHAQGLISAIQLKMDQMSVERANTLLKMCTDHKDHRQIGATLDIFDAKQLYEQKRLNLSRLEQLMRKGFITQKSVDEEKAKVQLAERKLRLAESKLKELNKKLGAPPPTKNNANK